MSYLDSAHGFLNLFKFHLMNSVNPILILLIDQVFYYLFDHCIEMRRSN